MLGKVINITLNNEFPKDYNLCSIEDFSGEIHNTYINKKCVIKVGNIIQFKPLASGIRTDNNLVDTYLIIDSIKLIARDSTNYYMELEEDTYTFVLDEYLNLFYTCNHEPVLKVLTRMTNLNLKRIPLIFKGELAFQVIDNFSKGDRALITGHLTKHLSNNGRIDYKFLVTEIETL